MPILLIARLEGQKSMISGHLGYSPEYCIQHIPVLEEIILSDANK